MFNPEVSAASATNGSKEYNINLNSVNAVGVAASGSGVPNMSNPASSSRRETKENQSGAELHKIEIFGKELASSDQAKSKIPDTLTRTPEDAVIEENQLMITIDGNLKKGNERLDSYDGISTENNSPSLMHHRSLKDQSPAIIGKLGGSCRNKSKLNIRRQESEKQISSA